MAVAALLVTLSGGDDYSEKDTKVLSPSDLPPFELPAQAAPMSTRSHVTLSWLASRWIWRPHTSGIMRESLSNKPGTSMFFASRWMLYPWEAAVRKAVIAAELPSPDGSAAMSCHKASVDRLVQLRG